MIVAPPLSSLRVERAGLPYGDVLPLSALLAEASPTGHAVPTKPDDPALII